MVDGLSENRVFLLFEGRKRSVKAKERAVLYRFGGVKIKVHARMVAFSVRKTYKNVLLTRII